MDDQVKSIDTALLEGSADYIVLSALLEQMEAQWDMVKDATEEKRAELGKVCQRASKQIHILNFTRNANGAILEVMLYEAHLCEG